MIHKIAREGDRFAVWSVNDLDGVEGVIKYGYRDFATPEEAILWYSTTENISLLIAIDRDPGLWDRLIKRIRDNLLNGHDECVQKLRKHLSIPAPVPAEPPSSPRTRPA